jgi:hypothetical protein
MDLGATHWKISRILCHNIHCDFILTSPTIDTDDASDPPYVY